MAPSSTPTAASGSAVESRYIEAGAEFEGSSVVIAGDRGIAGITDPLLATPIDFDDELAERKRTYAAIEVVDSDVTNDAFGI